MSIQRQLVVTSTIISVPREVASCPYCDANLAVQAVEWTQRKDGTWKATGIEPECANEPDIDTEEWEEWWAIHSEMPYVYQLPVDIKIEKWLSKNYDWDLS